MQIVKDIWHWLVALFPGWWKWVWIGLGVLDVIGRYASSFNPWVEQNRWVTFYIFIGAIFVAEFMLHRRQVEKTDRLQEENQKLKHEIEELKKPKVDPEIRRVVVEGWCQLKPEEKEAVRHLLLHDTLSERQALEYLHKKGMAMNWMGVFQNIAQTTNLVERVVQERQRDEHVVGYTGPWRIKPKFTEALKEIINAAQPTP